MNVAIIPARGGSKRIPGKNARKFSGKPIIGWSIEVAKESGCFDRIVVSTDSEEIAEISLRLGAEVPFLRPDSISDDHTGTGAVVRHALEELMGDGARIELACCIYATAPFLRALDLQDGRKRLVESDADYAFSVTKYEFPIQRALRIVSNNRVEMIAPQYADTRSQDLEGAFHDAGQFYWGKVEAWMSSQPIFSHRSVAVNLPSYRVQDIDDLDDWCRAELMFEALQKQGSESIQGKEIK